MAFDVPPLWHRVRVLSCFEARVDLLWRVVMRCSVTLLYCRRPPRCTRFVSYVFLFFCRVELSG